MFEDLNDVIHSKRLMQKKLGAELTRQIKYRYNQMNSFTSFFDLQSSRLGKIESLEGSFKGCYSVRLNANFRLIFRAKTEELSAESLKLCDTLIIEGVIDYHGSKYNWIIP